MLLAVISASVVILTAAYILWTVQRVYLGPEYKGPHPEALTPMTRREIAIAAPLLAFAILFGVYPRALLDYSTPSVDQTVDRLTHWTQQIKQPKLQQLSVLATPGRMTPTAADANLLPLRSMNSGEPLLTPRPLVK